MRKRLLPAFLALCMVLALLSTAFAADKGLGLHMNRKIADALRMEPTALTLQSWTDVMPSANWTDEDWISHGLLPGSYPTNASIHILTKGGKSDFSSDSICELPPGLILTVDAYHPNKDLATVPCYYIQFHAWSDPDGDGVYDMRLYTSEDGLISSSADGPVTAQFFSYYAAPDAAASSAELCSVFVPVLGKFWDISPTVRFTSDALIKLFGANTFLEISVATGAGSDEWNPKYTFYHFLLTDGEEAPEPAKPAFTDVSAGIWYADAVAWAAEEGYVSGTGSGTFTPNRGCTEAEVLTFLWNSKGRPESNARLPSSTADGQWYSGALRWAVEQGMIDDAFRLDTPCTRAASVYFLWRAYGSQNTAGGVSFPDVPADANYAKAVAWAVGEGIVEGSGGLYNPNGVFTRASIALLLHRTLVPGVRVNVTG